MVYKGQSQTDDLGVPYLWKPPNVYGPWINFWSQPIRQSFKRTVAYDQRVSDMFHSWFFLVDSSPKRPFCFPYTLGKPLATLSVGSVSLQLEDDSPTTLKPKPQKEALISYHPKHVALSVDVKKKPPWPPWLRLTDASRQRECSRGKAPNRWPIPPIVAAAVLQWTNHSRLFWSIKK